MAAELKILFVEDLPTDVELAKRTLSKEGIKFQSHVVENETDFIHQLEKFVPDIIISDYKMPAFNGMRALNLALEKCPNTPFILLTGSMNEEVAVECIKAGAWDYIIKEHITRLPFAVKETIEKKKISIEKLRAEKAVRESEERFRSLIEHSHDAITLLAADGNVLYDSPSIVYVLGYSPTERIGRKVFEFVHPEERQSMAHGFAGFAQQTGAVAPTEVRFIHKDGTPRWIEGVRTNLLHVPAVEAVVVNYHDITERKHAEEEIQNLAKFPSENPGPIMRIAHDGTLLYVNEAGIKQLPDWKLQTEQSAPNMLQDVVFNTMNNGAVQVVEFEHSEKVYSFYVAPIVEAGYANLYGHDITERKRAEEALQENEKRYKELFDNAPIGYHELDLQGRITRVNRTELDMLGYTEEEMIGQFVWKFAGDEETAQQRVLGKLKGILLPAISAESVYRRKDLTTFPVLLEEKILRDATDNIIGIRTTIQDITERKRTEEEIAMLAHSLRRVNECVSITDIEDKIIFVNESFLKTYGYNENELVGKHVSIVRSLNNPPELVKEILPATLLGGWQGELWNKRKDGSEFPIYLSTTIINNKDGKPLGLIGVATDITERKRAEQELIIANRELVFQNEEKEKRAVELIIAKERAEEMSRLKTNFLANMSHELRTPLNGILGYADILTSQLDEPELIEMTQGIYQSGKRLSETLNFILDLSEAEVDKIEVITKDIAVVPLAKNSINSFSKEAAKRNLQLETIVKEGNIFAHLDEHLFIRILYNLLDNAIRFTKKGKIIVEIGKELIDEKDWLYIKVKDTGIGIAHDKIDLIWDEFRQVSEGLTRSYEGAGLGLTISKKAVELMQGVISVESELGVGSIFTVKFPAVNVIPQKEELVQEKQAEVIQQEKEAVETPALPLVLYVEDDFVNRHIVKLFLNNTCIVETAEDGETALQLAAEKKYGVILIDINLGGGMNGMEVVKELLKMTQYAGTPIIAVTAYVTGKDKAEFLKGGCTNYIAKPFQKRELIDLVTSVLKNN